MKEHLISMQANQLRKKWGADSDTPIDIFALALRCDRLTVIYNDLGQNISGMIYKGDQSSIICINTSMTLGRQRFSMAHELYHLLFDDEMGTIVCPANINLGNNNEKKADLFAACLLMPENGVYGFIENTLNKTNMSLSAEDVVKLEQYFQVSHRSMLTRLHNLDLISKKQMDSYLDSPISRAESLNYGTELYRPTGRKETCGYHIALTRKLYDQDKISFGKFREVLRDAFREDVLENDLWEDLQ